MMPEETISTASSSTATSTPSGVEPSSINPSFFTRESKNQYSAQNFKEDTMQTVTFYELNEDGSFLTGTTVEELLRLCAERLGDLNARLPNDYTVQAINKIREALSQLHARTADRTTRGVEGTHQE